MSRFVMVLLTTVLVFSTAGCREDLSGPTAAESEPALAVTATAALAFQQVSAGQLHTCGVTTDNRVYCWGSGMLGDGTTLTRLKPVPIGGALRFRQVSAGISYTCGVTLTYQAYCWGRNEGGMLGDGTETDRLTPVAVAGGHLFRLIEAGVSHTCGVSYPDNKAYCWGYGGEGALGQGPLGGSSSSLIPIAVAGGRSWRQVSPGGGLSPHTCGVTTSNEPFCWGDNEFGKLGTGDEDIPRPARTMTPLQVDGGRWFRQVDTGENFSCGVTTSYRIFCWGNGRNGQLGDGKQFLRFWPKVPVASSLSFERVSTGGSHVCAETTNNRVYCWGVNTDGELGDGTNTRRLVPVAVAGGHFFDQVSAGLTYYPNGGHTCGKTSTGAAYCWGSNSHGQLGDGTTTSRPTPVPVSGG
jgi:alpha-tubulin suppressor-like RCC1 family protein